MLNFRTLYSLVLSVVLGVGTVACDSGPAPQKEKIKPLYTLSVDGVGPINASTPFNLHLLTEAFDGLNVDQPTNFYGGQQYPTIRVRKGIKPLLTINPDVSQSKVFSVVVEDNLVENSLHHRLGMSFAEIYPYGQTENCAPGMEEWSGKVMCYAPKTGNILYLFGGSWNGPTGTVPPLDVLASWTLEAIVWKPPVEQKTVVPAPQK